MKNLILLLLSLSAAQVLAKPSLLENFVEIRPGVRLYVEHHPAARGRPTLVLLNGLTYSTKEFEPYIKAMRELDPGIGIVAYDMRGMGKTLMEDTSKHRDRRPVEQQAEDLHLLVKALRIPGSVSVMGLSYGGAVEIVHALRYSSDFENYIAVAPMIERLPEQDQLINTWVNTHKIMYPADPRNDEELYDFYLRNWIYTTYPMAEPVIWGNLYKIEAVFRMVQGVKDFNAFDVTARLPEGKFHLVAARQDEHVKLSRLNDLWNAIPASAKASYMRLDGSKHKIPEIWPKELAAWVLQILNKNPHLKRGLTFDGDPVEKVARSGSIQIPLRKEAFCENILGAIPQSR